MPLRNMNLRGKNHVRQHPDRADDAHTDHIFTRISDDVQMGADKLPASSNITIITNAFAIFLLRQYFMQVENELIEAAKLDGASEWRVILQIMMPMSKPALASIILFSFVGQWNEYFWPLVMTNADMYRTLPVAIAQLKEMEGMANWQIVMAGNAILVLPVLLVYLFASKQIMKSFAYSGIK